MVTRMRICFKMISGRDLEHSIVIVGIFGAWEARGNRKL